MPTISEIIDTYPFDKLARILSTDTWSLDELIAAITATKDPARLRLLIAALDRLLRRMEAIKRRAEERLKELDVDPGTSAQP